MVELLPGRLSVADEILNERFDDFERSITAQWQAGQLAFADLETIRLQLRRLRAEHRKDRQ